MKFGTLRRFEEVRQLPRRSVTDVLRGRAVRQTEKAIANELGVALHLISSRYSDFQSTNADNSDKRRASHRLNGGEK